MKNATFLERYLSQTLSTEEQVIEFPVSLEHTVWDGKNTRDAAITAVMKCISVVFDEPTTDDATLLLTVMSELTGQELSCEHLSHRMHMQPYIVLHMLGAVELAGIWRHLKCFNREDEIVNDKSKGYLVDVGLACQMFAISNPVAIVEHRSWGALFETFVVNRLAQQLPDDTHIFYWRTAHGSAEVDVVLQRGKVLYPIEIKSAVHVSVSNARKIEIFTRYYEADYQIAPGLVIYTGNRYYAMENGVFAVPAAMI
ncbi:MAG: uncharacterized protein QG604_580 [Candidatus Dependentiae bacterium]|nr:uncharacterized protein [Candidatus Dependentiae bacterium]